MPGILYLRSLEKLKLALDDLGLRMAAPKYGMRDRDVVALVPKDAHSLPMYSRELELFVGDLDEVAYWVEGVQWARNYDQALFGKNLNKNREKKENSVRHRRLVDILKQDDVKVDN